MVGRHFLFYIILEVNSNSEEEVACFSVNLINKIAEAVFISNLKRQELIGCCHTSLPSDVECVGAFHVIFCNEEAYIRTGEEANFGVAALNEVPRTVSFELYEARIPVLASFSNISSTYRPVERVVNWSCIRYTDIQSFKFRLRVEVAVNVRNVSTPPYCDVLLCTCAYCNYCKKATNKIFFIVDSFLVNNT